MAENSRQNPILQDVLLKNTSARVVLLHKRGMAAKSGKRASRNLIGERVKQARQGFDPPLTQDQLSGKLASTGVHLDRVALAKVESGLRSAFDFEVKALAAVLKVDANWLLGIETKPPTGAPKLSRGSKGQQ